MVVINLMKDGCCGKTEKGVYYIKERRLLIS